MHRRTVSAGTSVLALASAFLALAPVGAQVVCPGSYGGHLQGIAVDPGGVIFWSFTTALVKTDEKGKELATVSVPSHHGDLAFRDGKLYVAVNLGEFNEEAGRAKSFVYVYGAEKLDLLSKHPVPEVVHGAGGIACRDGRFFVVGGLPEGHEQNYVYEYDEAFAFAKRHVVRSGYTLMGIQTACFARGRFWFGCYGDPRVLLETDPSFGMIRKYDFDAAL
ncbi:MAG: hypothetical protein JXP34_01945, partial [Planctomycetes bacterium]|nr:hypothetical protein [Planctomycetota bacterium]